MTRIGECYSILILEHSFSPEFAPIPPRDQTFDFRITLKTITLALLWAWCSTWLGLIWASRKGPLPPSVFLVWSKTVKQQFRPWRHRGRDSPKILLVTFSALDCHWGGGGEVLVSGAFHWLEIHLWALLLRGKGNLAVGSQGSGCFLPSPWRFPSYNTQQLLLGCLRHKTYHLESGDSGLQKHHRRKPSKTEAQWHSTFWHF